MAYTKVAWDEATPLSPTNLNLMDDGIFDATTKLGEIVLASPAASVTFSSIPSTYTHLYLVVYGLHDGAGFVSLNLRFNGDASGLAYQSVRRWSTVLSGTTFDFGSNTVLRVGVVNGSSRSAVGILIPRYAKVGGRKVAYGSGLLAGPDDASLALTEGGGQWSGATDAITSVFLSANGQNWVSTSEFQLYGMR